jgi:glucose uptake protein GlcU
MGGRQLVIGLLLLVACLLAVVWWHAFEGLWMLVVGGIPLVLMVGGAVLIGIAAMDLKAHRGEAAEGQG